LAAFLPCTLVPLAAAPPLLEKTTVFEARQGGYNRYRIPGVVVTKKGTVLAYCEARRNTGNDWDTIDLMMRRSTDGGRTFSPPRTIAHVPGLIERSPVAIERHQANPTDVTYDNPVAIADRNGVVHFVFALEYMRVFYMRSVDDGVTFSTPREITATFDAFRPEYAWRVLATGPGHGIQLRAGRLLIPVWLSLGTAGNGHHPSVDATVYSDDHGQTWRRGVIAVPDTPGFPDPNETAAVELSDGRTMLNVRTQSKENRRTIVLSADGATGWSAPRLDANLPDPICFAALLRFSFGKARANRLLFVNPDSLNERRNLTVRLSYDDGASWPAKRVLEPGPSAYADLARLPDGTILCFYEKGPYESLVLARFNPEWLSDKN
jgi:sialidase-1